MDQPGKVANPARGQLNRENEYSHHMVSHEYEYYARARSKEPRHMACVLLRRLYLLHCLFPRAVWRA